MPTRNLHINVALEALEMHEDAVLVRVADERIAALAGRKTLTHVEVWE